jgi:hypothetical protein
MKRSEFLGSAAFGIVGGTIGRSIFPDQTQNKPLGLNPSVKTAQKRLKYTWKMLNKLCRDIGPRPTDSTKFIGGANIIRDEMERSLPVVKFDNYEFEKWELIEKPEFKMEEQRIETYPVIGTKSTPPKGISGILQKNGDGFKLIDYLSAEVKAKILVSKFGKAIPNDPIQSSLPVFGVGKQDVPLIKHAIANKTPATLKGWSRRIPNVLGRNVIGRLSGKQKNEILFIAHADTVYAGPGAIDNTASVIIMLMLAHAAIQNRNNFTHTLTFVASDGEEFKYAGAKHYAEQRRKNNTMRNIRYIINFDSLTYGPKLWVSSKQKGLKNIIRSIRQDLNIKSTFTFDNSDGFVMDSAPFRSSRAKAMHVNSRGYNEKTLPVYHRPEDTAPNVPLDCVELSFLVFNKFITKIDKL